MKSNHITLLPEHIICRISAGEVVERPAGALKELIENSIDAGSTHIDIFIENGGKTFLKVIDNGQGIPKDQIAIALKRHATSKLYQTNNGEFDLENISHLGFRGEALAAISSVSDLTIESFYDGQPHGYALASKAGHLSELKPSSIAIGTSVTIENLFYAVPARLGFLKTERAEQSAIYDVVKRQALINSHVSFSVQDQAGRNLINYNLYPDDTQGFSRVADILGHDFIENAMTIALENDSISICGYSSVPTYHRGNGLQQYFFVNGRAVRDKMFSGILRAAYSEHMARDKHPICVLFINLPAHQVDVNVHPTKAEVRFKNDSLVRGSLINAIRQAIGKIGHLSSSHNTKLALNKIVPSTLSSQHNETEIIQESQPIDISQQKSITPKLNNFPKFDFYSSQIKNTHSVNQQLEQAFAIVNSTGNHDYHSGEIINTANQYSTSSVAREEIITYETTQQHTHQPLGVAVAQLHLTYILSQTENGLIIVDQHAAHERIILEKVKNALKLGGQKPQDLLIPEIIELTDYEQEILLNHLLDLEKLGLVIESFGANQILVRSIPAFFSGGNVKALIKDLVDDFSDNRGSDTLDEKINHICATFACHHSVRAGRKLNPIEMNALLREMETTSGTGQCNHGRPTYISLDKKDIERLFGRK